MPEQHLVPGLVWYNQHCANNNLEKLDGVAVNNEAFDKHGSEQVKVDYLENLAKIGFDHFNAEFYFEYFTFKLRMLAVS